MGNSFEILDNNLPFKTVFTQVLSARMAPSNSPVLFVNTGFRPQENIGTICFGMDYIVRLRSRGDTILVVFYGFDGEDRLRKRPEATVLNSEGVFYLRMPFSLEELSGVLSDVVGCGKVENPLDEATWKAEVVKTVRLLKHNLANLLGTIEPNINAIRDAGHLTVKSEWSVAKRAVIRAGRDRIRGEIGLYEESMKGLLEGTSPERHKSLHNRFLKADRCYTELFDVFDGLNGYSENGRKVAVGMGEKLIGILKDITNKLEAMEDEYCNI